MPVERSKCEGSASKSVYTQAQSAHKLHHSLCFCVCMHLYLHPGKAMEWAGGGNKREIREREAIEIKMTEIVRARKAERRQRGLAAEQGRYILLRALAPSHFFLVFHTPKEFRLTHSGNASLCGFHAEWHMPLNTQSHKHGQSSWLM